MNIRPEDCGAPALVSIKFTEGVAHAVDQAFKLALDGARSGDQSAVTTALVLQMAAGAMQGYVTAISENLGKGTAAAILHQLSIDNGLGLVRGRQ